MATIISPARRVYVREHEFHFDSLEHPGSGYCFGSDESRQPICRTPLHEESLARARALVAAGKMREVGYRTYERSYWEQTILRCECGRELELYDSLSNTCECGAEYNGCGQRLAPRSQWSDEDRYAVDGPQNLPEDY